MFWWPEQVENLKISMFWWPEHETTMKIAFSCGQNIERPMEIASLVSELPYICIWSLEYTVIRQISISVWILCMLYRWSWQTKTSPERDSGAKVMLIRHVSTSPAFGFQLRKFQLYSARFRSSVHFWTVALQHCGLDHGCLPFRIANCRACRVHFRDRFCTAC